MHRRRIDPFCPRRSTVVNAYDTRSPMIRRREGCYHLLHHACHGLKARVPVAPSSPAGISSPKWRASALGQVLIDLAYLGLERGVVRCLAP